MRYAVLGAGGGRALVGGALARAGHPVTLLVRPERRDHYPERMTVESEALGAFEAPVRIADRLDEQFDVVWITVKAMALEEAPTSSLRRDSAVASWSRCSTALTTSNNCATARARAGPAGNDARRSRADRAGNAYVTAKPSPTSWAGWDLRDQRGRGHDALEQALLPGAFALAATASGNPPGLDAQLRAHGGVRQRGLRRGVAEGARVAPGRSSRRSKGCPTVSEADARKTWLRDVRRRSMPSPDLYSVAVERRFPPLVPSWTGS